METNPDYLIKQSLDNLYQRFKQELEAVSGECYRVSSRQEANRTILKILWDIKSPIVLSSSALTICGDLAEYLSQAGLSIITDDYWHKAPEADVGITGAYLAIAETGTLVQAAVDVDERLCSSLPPLHLVVIPTQALVGTMAETLERMRDLPEIPGFVGFITGPSRTSDIERVLTIGVHGPSKLVVVFVDGVREVA